MFFRFFWRCVLHWMSLFLFSSSFLLEFWLDVARVSHSFISIYLKLCFIFPFSGVLLHYRYLQIYIPISNCSFIYVCSTFSFYWILISDLKTVINFFLPGHFIKSHVYNLFYFLYIINVFLLYSAFYNIYFEAFVDSNGWRLFFPTLAYYMFCGFDGELMSVRMSLVWFLWGWGYVHVPPSRCDFAPDWHLVPA